MKKIILLLSYCLLASHILWAQYATSTYYDYPGIFHVPPGVSSITVEMWGGGANGSATLSGSAGGGGAYTRCTLVVTPGQKIYATPAFYDFNGPPYTFVGPTSTPTTVFAYANSGNGYHGGAASAVGGNTVESFPGGNGGYNWPAPQGGGAYFAGGGGAAAGRLGAGAAGGGANDIQNGTFGIGTGGGGSGNGGTPGGGRRGDTNFGYGQRGRVIIYWYCVAGVGNYTLAQNDHTIPWPQELSSDVVSIYDSLPTGNGLNYTWKNAINGEDLNTTGYSVDTTNPFPGLDGYNFLNSNYQGTWNSVDYRLQSNACATTSYSNVVRWKIFSNSNVNNGFPSKNGSFKGYVRSRNNSGVAGITVKATRTTLIKGSPLNYTYYTTTGNDGGYIFNNLFYGDKDNDDSINVNFTITPEKTNHLFDPPNSPNRAIRYDQYLFPQEVNFTDTTVLAITGKLYQQCQGCLNAQINPVNTVQAGIDSAATLTGGQVPVYSDGITGAYSATVNNPGSRTFIPSYKNHQFKPASSTKNVQDNISNLNFQDTTTFTISGKLTDGCGKYMGQARLLFTDIDTLRNSGSNNRTYSFRKRDTTRTDTGHLGNFSVRLPAGRAYRVKVEGFVPNVDTTNAAYVNPNDFADFFNTRLPKDSLTGNIDTANATLNLVYRRAPVLQIVGLNDTICNPLLLGVVFNQNVARQFWVNVFEGPAGLGCPVKTNDIVPRKDSLAISDSVKILTDVPDISGTAPPKNLFYRLTGGVGNVSFVPGVPNIVAPFHKKFEVFYTDKYGRLATSIDRTVVVTGIQSPPQTFVTTSPELPLLILHRPPGDQSYSFWEQTKSIETALRMSVATSNAISGYEEVKVGASFSAGIGVEIETKVVASVNVALGVTNTTTTGNESILSTSTTTKYSTKAGGILGSAGDVYVGGAVNFKYGVSNVINFKAGTCNLFFDEKLIVAPDSLKTLYTYSEDHILNNIIPTLQFFVQKDTSTIKKKYYQNQLNVWQQVVDNNTKNKQNATFVENRSFDGNVGGVEVSRTLSETSSNSVEFKLEIDTTVVGKIGAEVDGSGIEGGATVAFKMETGKSTTNSSSTSTTTGYLLADQNAGDYYSVDIKRDPVYGTPSFDLVAGTSSCPPEPGAQSRDNGQLIVPKPIKNDIDNPLDTALFTVNLLNKSESREARTYNLNATKSSYNGIILSVDGVPLGSTIPLPYTLNYLQSLPITVRVQRNDPAKYSFTDMELTLTDNCTGDVQAVNYITANFKTQCGNINMANPEQDWVINSTGSNSLPVTFNGYTQPNVGQVTVEYAKKGSSNWMDGNSISGLLIASSSTTLPWNVSALVDSLYKVRLRLNCTNGTVIYTPYTNGIIDRRAPYVIGKPQPSDNNYINGDEVSFTYNENINTNNVSSANVQMIRLSNNTALNTSVSGYGNKLTIVPLDYIPAFNGDSIMVIVNNIADLFGNVKTTPDTSRFLIGTSPVVVGVDTVKVYASTLSLAENAAGQMEIRFKLPKNATRLIKVNFNIAGTALNNNDYTVILDSTITRQVGTTLQSVYGSFNGSQGYVYIKPGAKEGFIKIDPIGDAVFESNETVVTSLASGGDYTLTDSTVATATILNDDLAPPLVTATNGAINVCTAGSVTLTASAPNGFIYTSYLWSTGAITPSITVSNGGYYKVTVKDAGARTAYTVVYVGRTPIIIGATTANPACFGQVGAFQVNTANTGTVVSYKYKLDTANENKYQSLSVFKPMKAGTYKVNVKDSLGCVATSANINITQPNTITGTFTKTDASCIGKADGTITVTMTGGAAPYAYKIGLGGVYKDSKTLTGIKAGTYTVYVKDANGCVGPIGPVVVGQANVACLSFAAANNANNAAKENGMALVLTPNPSRNDFTLRVISNSKEAVRIKVSDELGRFLKTVKLQPNEPLVFGKELLPGMYLIEATQGNGKQIAKAIKLK